MQPATSETKIKSLYLSICVHHGTLRAPCPKGQGTGRRDWGVIRTSRSHWLARTCARRARVVKTDPKLRARHTKRHMNEGNAKKGPDTTPSSGL